MFVNYKNKGGNSNVEAYEIGPTYIRVRFFGNPRVYKYSYFKAGMTHVEEMKALANRGQGLNSYILLYCKYLYD